MICIEICGAAASRAAWGQTKSGNVCLLTGDARPRFFEWSGGDAREAMTVGCKPTICTPRAPSRDFKSIRVEWRVWQRQTNLQFVSRCDQICFTPPLERFAFGKTPRGPRCARQARQRLARQFVGLQPTVIASAGFARVAPHGLLLEQTQSGRAHRRSKRILTI